jgi:hypothetical protein
MLALSSPERNSKTEDEHFRKTGLINTKSVSLFQKILLKDTVNRLCLERNERLSWQIYPLSIFCSVTFLKSFLASVQ